MGLHSLTLGLHNLAMGFYSLELGLHNLTLGLFNLILLIFTFTPKCSLFAKENTLGEGKMEDLEGFGGTMLSQHKDY